MKKCVSLLLVFVLLLCGCLTACTKGEDADPSASDNASQFSEDEGTTAAPENIPVQTTKDPTGQSGMVDFKSFKGQTLDGQEVDSEIFKQAKLTVVNVWGTFCSPCIEELPHLGEIAKEYEAKGVQVIGLVGDVYNQESQIDSAVVEDAKSIVQDAKADYTHIIPDIELCRVILSNMTAFPTTYFVDSEGNFVDKAVVGAKDKAGWEEKIDAVLSSME
ncbi:MAG: TlpA family protein disulfide reductase [Acutalibacteraceae bacterium]